MPFHRPFASKMSDVEIGDEVTVVDVYDIASDIGKECEIIIDKFGAEAITSLLPKVINALELLESLATRNERENSTLQELNDKIFQLENDKLEKAEYRQRFEKELEVIEEQWRSDKVELVSVVTRLRDENRRLAKEKEDEGVSSTAVTPSVAAGEDQLWQRLGTVQDQLRAAVRDKEAVLEDKQKVVEGLTSQVKRLATCSREIRRKHKILLHQMRVVCGQRADLEALAQARHREVVALRQALANEKSGSGNGAQLAELMKERDLLKVELEALLKKTSAESEPPSVAETISDDSAAKDEEEEPPVQGPLPYEPDDAPWKRQPSGIRKFFRKLFSEYDVTVGSFPGRSLSTLTTKISAASTDK